MKIKIVESVSKKPILNSKVQLQVKGKDGGFLTLITDMAGFVELEQKYSGQQISSPLGGGQGPWVTITEGAVLLLPTKVKTTETH